MKNIKKWAWILIIKGDDHDIFGYFADGAFRHRSFPYIVSCNLSVLLETSAETLFDKRLYDYVYMHAFLCNCLSPWHFDRGIMVTSSQDQHDSSGFYFSALPLWRLAGIFI